jgi:hypothetical protein
LYFLIMISRFSMYKSRLPLLGFAPAQLPGLQ